MSLTDADLDKHLPHRRGASPAERAARAATREYARVNMIQAGGHLVMTEEALGVKQASGAPGPRPKEF